MYLQAYMGQMVAVQHKRGAQGGLVFARALNLDLNLGDTGEDRPEVRRVTNSHMNANIFCIYIANNFRCR